MIRKITVISISWRCIVIVLCLSKIGASGNESIVSEVLITQRNQLLKVKTIDMEYSEDTEANEYIMNKYVGPSHSITRFQMENEKFRVETGLEDSAITGGRIRAFDMEKYQLYDKNSMDLMVTSQSLGSMDRDNIPFRNTYKWIFLNLSSFSFSDFQNESTWNGLKHRVRHVESSIVQDHECLVVEFDYSEINMFSRVYFAKDLDYFPIKVEVYQGGKRVVEHVVIEAEAVETQEGTVVLPVQTVEKQWSVKSGNFQFKHTCTINMKKSSINKDIPDEMFTIPLHMVRSYNNYIDGSKSFNVDRLIDQSIEDIAVQSSSVSELPKQVTTEDDNSVSIEPTDNSDYQNPTSVLPSNIGSGDIGTRVLVAKICGVVVLVLVVFAGLLFMKRHGERIS